MAELSLRARTPGAVDATVTRIGPDARRVVLARCRSTEHRGALHPVDGDTLAAAADAARESRLPLVLVIASSGADVTEGLPAVHGWGVAARAIVRCSGQVPIVAVAAGPAVSGPALLLGLSDHVVATEECYAFVSGPRMVRAFTGVAVDNAELGGAAALARWSGVASLVASDESDGLDAVAQLLSYVPDTVDCEPPTVSTNDPIDRSCPELAAMIPASATGGYDVRAVASVVVDDGELLELHSSWAPNLVTAFGTVGGRPVGVVANQPTAIAGTLDIAAAQKGARFVAFCDAFNIPLLTLVDTPGFYPGKDLEWRGMIRHGAQLAFAYARATVPRVCVVLRKAYGGAYIVMDSRHMGNDLYLAWPSAEIAVMGARGAVEILHRGADSEERDAAERAYEARWLNPWVAAERGSVDAVIEPADTRRQVVSAFEILAAKRERLVRRKHDNTPM